MRIVIVGAGLAAQRCAEALRANGHDGPITMFGAEPHAPYDRPPLSKAVLAGERPEAHAPRDRRRLLPLAPVDRPTAAHSHAVPGHGPASGPRLLRHRLAGGATAPVKIASGCDRRCTFCAIPRFRGAYLSRPPAEVVAEAVDEAAGVTSSTVNLPRGVLHPP